MAGGGPLFDIGSHRIDVLNFLFGEPQRVAGQLSNAVHALAVEDCATVMIEYATKCAALLMCDGIRACGGMSFASSAPAGKWTLRL